MKPFDLELAKLGHPLITRGGLKVVEFHHFKNTEERKSPHFQSCIYTSTRGGYQPCYKDGKVSNFNHDYEDDLLLDDTVPWNRLSKGEDEIKDYTQKLTINNLTLEISEEKAKQILKILNE